MLSAKEAARMTDEVLEKGFTDELQEIEKCIERKIAKGEYTYSYEGYISLRAKSELNKLGYEVKTGSQYNQGYVIINWHPLRF